jgi:glycosyltransferase involved in cell wall biosynthesis
MGVWRTIKGSRIDINKGFEEMLDMVKLLEENKVDYYWYIVGSGGAEYERKIRNMYQPYPRVIFTDNEGPYLTNTRLGTKIRGLKRINQEFENKEYSMDKQ